ncbi:AraC family transcriptional regulator [Urechidicola croceus]|uniref:AraC family transcriptional regulator n=1 Tax=Urechidicola croceus TaxID=1850246 RepID=A0A1D8P5E3_9FLAO|nr:AraC family transcriptional regulator [Urechidicola croceus]AOW19784.1 AraC family transcriptional regulator [Urechidicola croceus]
MLLPEHFYTDRKLEDLVENKTSYTLESSAMHIFETHKRAEKVLLQFDQPVLASMIVGKKVMHLREHNSFDFLPGESLILPSDEIMCIDFPEAKQNNPTRCLAIAIAQDKIKDVLQLMNETMPKHNGVEWGLMDYNFHFTNDLGIYQILQRLLFLFTENHASKDLFVNNMLRELIVRILQANSNKIYTDETLSLGPDNRLAFVIEYIRKNIREHLTIELLSKKACMSESHFYRVFKTELGISPVDFINKERIKLASSLLQNPAKTIKDVFIECGFESRSYFNRIFKRTNHITPKEYRAKATT